MDTRSPTQRRRIMQSVRQKHTGPELVVRSLLHRMGYRYRVHDKQLPGTPDIVFASRKRIVFVNGCFWHGHNCPKGRPPKSEGGYWREKLERNKERDTENCHKLELSGWNVLTVWQCETKDGAVLASRLRAFLGEPKIRSTRGDRQSTLESDQVGA